MHGNLQFSKDQTKYRWTVDGIKVESYNLLAEPLPSEHPVFINLVELVMGFVNETMCLRLMLPTEIYCRMHLTVARNQTRNRTLEI